MPPGRPIAERSRASCDIAETYALHNRPKRIERRYGELERGQFEPGYAEGRGALEHDDSLAALWRLVGSLPG